jgi:hypothetical protein
LSQSSDIVFTVRRFADNAAPGEMGDDISVHRPIDLDALDDHLISDRATAGRPGGLAQWCATLPRITVKADCIAVV